ncbi:MULTISPECIES: DUF742 domain-containing protein [unclassified Solwaraspora]|uniref:DUF742 domain-containing protein n=1 Tax=unclassified Solwaraspora TaxID=2627926 RepID=UPI00259BEC0C|nr:DUF742 domain-containing protein [Solwaraspora sp. WMMA2056]WJK40323.1 DUF742 domain-containing protein [Solwaraspora sp. WMMA2056]
MTRSPFGADDPAEPPVRIRPYLRTPPVDGAGPDDGRGGTGHPVPPPAAPAGAGAGPTGAPTAASGLRPFVLTAGRVAGADPDIGLETQVTARVPDMFAPAAPLHSLAPELQAIIALAADPISVAELSARLGLHLGVTRVLVGDLRATDHLDVHVPDVEAPADADTILRVIRGLRAIS